VLIFSPTKLHIDRWLHKSTRIAACALGMLALALGLFFIAYPWNSRETDAANREMKQKNAGALFAYEAIGSGGLALHPRHALGWVSRLADELALIAYNSRPDIESKNAKMLLSLKNGKELLTLSNGRTLFLKEAQQGKGLSSSETATGLWVKPILLENGAVLIETGRKLVSKEGKSGEEKGEFIVAPQGGIPARYNPTQQGFIKELKSGRSFPQDLLIQKYGGREYSPWREKAVFEMTRGSSSYACFVSSGDYLVYEEGEWRVVPFEELKKDQPIAHVKSISGKGLEIEAWDETGFYPLQVTIETEKPGRFQLKPDAMPSGIRIRSGTQVSCAFGKRRVILKQGDWLLKTTTGWRNLRRAEEIEQYLHHRIKGELLIFDSIEKEQGRLVMKGNIFDETRTQIQPFSLPIDGDKSPGKTTRKRKPISPNPERRAA
jgi:hypothetical protein